MEGSCEALTPALTPVRDVSTFSVGGRLGLAAFKTRAPQRCRTPSSPTLLPLGPAHMCTSVGKLRVKNGSRVRNSQCSPANVNVDVGLHSGNPCRGLSVVET